MRFAALLLGVICLNLFAFVTIQLRAGIFGVRTYKPMMWNFLLSVLPLIILSVNIILFTLLSMLGAYTDTTFFSVLAYIMFFFGLIIWLLFLPNSGYLITELNLSHRALDDREVPMWYDIVSTLALALSGITNTLLNIVILQTSFLVVFDPNSLTPTNYTQLFLGGLGIIVLIVVGIYLGRAVRFNSWDAFHPLTLIGRLREHFSAKGTLKEFGLYVMINTVFFLIMYVSFGIPFYFI